ncbi:hypothetical protein BC835DRAFT_1272714, partial [Cytidiella melzeri]
STHNTRIERLWVEVGSQFARRWRAFFSRLERLHHLKIKDPQHMWLLHFLFLDMINSDCDQFCADWNAKPLFGIASHRSPNDLRFIGQTEHGVYIDNLTGVHPDIIAEYYGAHGRLTHCVPGQTGARHSSDEDSNSDEHEGLLNPGPDVTHIEAAVEQNHGHNFNHEAVNVPESETPFATHADEVEFCAALVILQDSHVVPGGYGLLPDEWEDSTYPTLEVLRSSRRGRREITISLPETVWQPRAELWACAVELLVRLTE